jgi:hypothetical protein
MKQMSSVLGCTAAIALLVTVGCSKQEPPATPTSDNTSKSQTTVTGEKPQPAQPPKAAESQVAAPAAPEPAVAAKPAEAAPAVAAQPADATPAPTSPAAVPARAAKKVASQSSTPTADQAVAKAPAVPATDTNVASLASLQQSGTDQLRALAAAATNQALTALGMTNQAAVTATNQVQALLDQAKNLTANQKYQEALSTLSQAYATKLTPDQKQQADALKAQIQTSMTEKATSALGNFLGGKK